MKAAPTTLALYTAALVPWACTSFEPIAPAASHGTSAAMTAASSIAATANGSATSGHGGSGDTTGVGGARMTNSASSAGSGGAGIGGSGLGGAGTGGSGGSPPPPDYCSICALTDTFPVELGAIDEASGIAASRVHPGVYFVNNDSGDLPRFFALASDGKNAGILSMPVTHVDYEDIDVGPCSGGHCIFVADIGDNDELRTSCVLYRVPDLVTLGDATVKPDALPFTYPDGPHNAETLLIHPITGEIVIVTKVKVGSSLVFRAPDAWAPDQSVVLTKVGEIAPPSGSPRITGGSVHPLGHGILLRTYSNVYYYPASAPDSPIAETLSHVPCALPAAVEPQGEAVAWTLSGDGYVTVSEMTSTSLHYASCHER